MNRDLGFSAAVYGLGSGLFFLSYTLLEVPSNLMLVRLGARVWIARIMFTWGVMSTGMIFVERPALLLSPAHAAGCGGGRVFSRLDLLPDALVPRARARRSRRAVHDRDGDGGCHRRADLSALLQLDGAFGLRGWQWLFLIEGCLRSCSRRGLEAADRIAQRTRTGSSPPSGSGCRRKSPRSRRKPRARTSRSGPPLAAGGCGRSRLCICLSWSRFTASASGCRRSCNRRAVSARQPSCCCLRFPTSRQPLDWSSSARDRIGPANAAGTWRFHA